MSGCFGLQQMIKREKVQQKSKQQKKWVKNPNDKVNKNVKTQKDRSSIFCERSTDVLFLSITNSTKLSASRPPLNVATRTNLSMKDSIIWCHVKILTKSMLQ